MIAEALLKASMPFFQAFPWLRGRGRLHRWLGVRIPRTMRRSMSENFVMDLDPRDGWQCGLLLCGQWEPETGGVLREHLKPGSVFYDVGANIGYTSLLAADALGATGSVVAFEPLPHNLRQLEANVTLNGYSNVRVVPFGLSDRKETATIHYPAGGFELASMIRHQDTTVHETVEFVTGDDLVAAQRLPPPDVIKIDVEGAEFKVLSGLRSTIDARPRLHLVLEITPFFLESLGSSETALRTLLQSMGFVRLAVISRGTCTSRGAPIDQTNELFAKGTPA